MHELGRCVAASIACVARIVGEIKPCFAEVCERMLQEKHQHLRRRVTNITIILSCMVLEEPQRCSVIQRPELMRGAANCLAPLACARRRYLVC